MILNHPQNRSLKGICALLLVSGQQGKLMRHCGRNFAIAEIAIHWSNCQKQWSFKNYLKSCSKSLKNWLGVQYSSSGMQKRNCSYHCIARIALENKFKVIRNGVLSVNQN